MPIPTPKAQEKQKDFMDRCMNDSVMIQEYKTNTQRYAICSVEWKRPKK